MVELEEANSERNRHLRKLKQTISIKLPSSRRTNRPQDAAFKQQRLPAWQPIITSKTAIPVLLVIGLIFIPIGIGVLITSDDVQEIIVDYTDCLASSPEPIAGQKCSDVIADDILQECKCNLNMTINADLMGDVFFYYGLSNYYQNLRRYVSSRDYNQLLGHGQGSLSDCKPFIRPGSNQSIVSYAPCGSIANSFFNDSIALFSNESTGARRIEWDKKGIAWITDRLYKFRNPADNFANTVRPPSWRINIEDLGKETGNGIGYENEDFMVWMRTAAMTNFRKLYARLERSANNSATLKAGSYNALITYSEFTNQPRLSSANLDYPVAGFDGRKKFIISTTSWLGSKNSFLGYAYIVTGVLCTLTGVAFLLLHVIYGPRLTETNAYNF